MKIGIIGLPNVGKSALFNALTGENVDSQNYPFCTIEPNVSTVKVYDERLVKLAKMYNSKKIINAVVEFVDIAGLIKGASKGEGLGNKFLNNIREVHSIVHVVRCFENEEINHVYGKVDPISDIETVNLELIFYDIEVVNKKIERLKKKLKIDKKYKIEIEFWCRVLKHLEIGNPIAIFKSSQEEKKIIDDAFLLTSKPMIYVANINENSFLNNIENDINYKKVEMISKNQNTTVIPICAEIESQISSFSEDEKIEFLKEANINEFGLNTLIKASYDTLGLISFLTAGPTESRAWVIKEGTIACDAAEKIHSDIKKGFIKAEIVNYKTIIECGSMAAVREKGLLNYEGKNYIMKDGDVTLFKFNV